MKTLIGVPLQVVAVVLFAGSVGGCASWFPPDPKCQGDPALKPCPCMDPRTPGCPAPPNDDFNPISDAKKPTKETAK